MFTIAQMLRFVEKNMNILELCSQIVSYWNTWLTHSTFVNTKIFKQDQSGGTNSH